MIIPPSAIGLCQQLCKSTGISWDVRKLWSYIHRTPETVEFPLGTVEIAIPTTDASHLTRYLQQDRSYTSVSSTTFNNTCASSPYGERRNSDWALLYLGCKYGTNYGAIYSELLQGLATKEGYPRLNRQSLSGWVWRPKMPFVPRLSYAYWGVDNYLCEVASRYRLERSNSTGLLSVYILP